MRSCMYCGRELKGGEQCSCSMAAARRAAKDTDDKKDEKRGKKQEKRDKRQEKRDKKQEKRESSYYRTGYTASDKASQWKIRYKTKAEERKNRKNKTENLFRDIVQFLKSPVDGVMNPKSYSNTQMLLIAAVQGALIGMGVFFVSTGASRSWFRALANIVGFGGADGYRTLLNIVFSAVSGAVSGIIFFGIYTGIFYLINKFVFRLRGTFADMAQRLIFTTIPGTVLTAAGVAFSFFSTTTLMILMLCGGVMTIILSYTALNSEWSVYSRKNSLYGAALGYFILFTIVCSLLRISIIGG